MEKSGLYGGPEGLRWVNVLSVARGVASAQPGSFRHRRHRTVKGKRISTRASARARLLHSLLARTVLAHPHCNSRCGAPSGSFELSPVGGRTSPSSFEPVLTRPAFTPRARCGVRRTARPPSARFARRRAGLHTSLVDRAREVHCGTFRPQPPNTHGVLDENRPHHPAPKAVAPAEPAVARLAHRGPGTKTRSAYDRASDLLGSHAHLPSRFSTEARGSPTALAALHLDARALRGLEACRSAATATARRSLISASSDARSSGTSGRGSRHRRPVERRLVFERADLDRAWEDYREARRAVEGATAREQP